MASSPLLRSIGILLIVVAALLSARVATSEPAEDTTEIKLLSCIYTISDLPVWRTDGERQRTFDPSLLIAYIKKSISDTSWEHGAAIRKYDDPKFPNSIIAAQTETNHDQIREIIDRFRHQD